MVVAAAAFHAPMGVVQNSQVARVSMPATMQTSKLPYRTKAFWQDPEWEAMQAAAEANRPPPTDYSTPAPAVAAATAAPAVAASAEPVSDMTVAQACAFMADPSVAKVSFEEKKAFLSAKGVPDFVIAEAACTAPDTTLVL